MTYEEFDKRCDELENAPLQERKTFFADVLAGETSQGDVNVQLALVVGNGGGQVLHPRAEADPKPGRQAAVAVVQPP